MPKRKAITRISGLVDSDDEVADDAAIASHRDSHDAPPTKKARGRPRSAGAKIDEQTAASKSQRSSSAGIVKQNAPTVRKVAGRGRPRTTIAGPEPIEENTEDEAFDNLHTGRENARNEVATTESSPARKRKGRGRETENNAKQVTEDGEFEYTPTGSRQLKHTEDTVIPDSQNPTSATNGATIDEATFVDKRPNAVSPLKSLTNGERPGRKRATVTFADTEKTSSDPELRRKLGDMTKKYETLEVKYRNLREIGVVEANANFEKIRKQCENATSGKTVLSVCGQESLLISLQRQINL